MTDMRKNGIIETTNPVLTDAPTDKEDHTDMSGAKITALYCRLSQEDERLGESLSIEHQDLICQGIFHLFNKLSARTIITYECGHDIEF